MTKRERMLKTFRKYQIGTCVSKFVAVDFQSMIRAEAGAKPDGTAVAIIDGRIDSVFRHRGQCVCVTCGKRLPWKSGIGGMHTGHFLGSRCFSIVLEEENVAPQCSSCNRYHSGMPQEFKQWMEHARGEKVIDRLHKLKATTRHFTRDELVDLKIEFKRRLQEAELEIDTGY